MIKICEECGKEYNTNNPSRHFCDECRSQKCCACGENSYGFYEGKPYCRMHLSRLQRHGDLTQRRSHTITNHYYIQGDNMIISTKNGELIYADSEDYDKLIKDSWFVDGSGYASKGHGNKNNPTKRMQRIVMEETDKEVFIDHITRNTLDNRKCNLRKCTRQENCRNKKQTKELINGVTFNKGKQKYEAYIVIKRPNSIYLGAFDNYEDAKEARLKAELEIFGEFAPNYEHNIPPVPDLILPRILTCPIYDTDTGSSENMRRGYQEEW